MEQIKWLADLFGSYDFYYLDPMVMKETKLSEKKITGIPDDNGGVQELLEKIGKIIGVNESDRNLNQFFENNIQKNLLLERKQQTQVAGAFAGAYSKNKIHKERKFNDLQNLYEAKWLEKTRGDASADCFVGIDGIITRVGTGSPSEWRSLVNVTSREEDRHLRMVHFMLSDRPGSMLCLEAFRIGLMVDQKGLNRTYETSTEVDLMTREGWYPFARVIGYWQTDRGGHPSLDVIAILMKSFPPLDRILREHEDNNPELRLTKMLKAGREKTQKRLEGLEAKPYVAREEDWELGYPFLLGSLCCHLNGIKLSQLKYREPTIAQSFEDYRFELVKLVKELKGRNIPTLLTLCLKYEKWSKE